MDKSLRDCLTRINGDMLEAINKGRICGAPFAEYTDTASAVFIGISTIIKIVQVADMARADKRDSEQAMTPMEVYSLLALAGAVSHVMARRAEDLADWADARMDEQEAKQ